MIGLSISHSATMVVASFSLRNVANHADLKPACQGAAAGRSAVTEECS
jgi:hypothetical protein